KDAKDTKDTKRISGEGHDTHARGTAPQPFTLNGPLQSSSCSSCSSGPSWWSGVGVSRFRGLKQSAASLSGNPSGYARYPNRWYTEDLGEADGRRTPSASGERGGGNDGQADRA